MALSNRSRRSFWIKRAVALALFVMLAVHILFSFEAPFPWMAAKWSAGDVLGYLGSIIGAGATIFVLLATIDYEKKVDEERSKRAVRPVIAITLPEKTLPEWGPSVTAEFEDDFDPIGVEITYERAREEYLRASCYAIVSADDGASFDTVLSHNDYYLALWAEAQVIKDEDGNHFGNDFQAWFLKLMLTSVGNGPAINVSARLVKSDVENAALEGSRTHSPVFQLMVGGEWGLGILVPAGSISAKEYCLVLSYEDVYGRAYEQSHVMTLSRLGLGGHVGFHAGISQRDTAGEMP